MSLWWRRRSIERAVAGELSGAEENALRRHLAGCEACRGHYDQLTRAARALGAREGAREEARLMAAIGAPVAPAAPERRAGVPWAFTVVPVAASILFAVLIWQRPGLEELDGVQLRGEGSEDASRVALRVYAQGKDPGAPVRLVADFPGAREGRISVRDRVQFRVADPKGRAHVRIVAIDASGVVQVYAPRETVQMESLRPGKARVWALFPERPIESDALRAAAPGDPSRDDARFNVDAEQVSGVLILDP